MFVAKKFMSLLEIRRINMIKAIESDLYRIEKAEGYDNAIKIIIKETYNEIVIFEEELDELIGLINKSREILGGLIMFNEKFEDLKVRNDVSIRIVEPKKAYKIDFDKVDSLFQLLPLIQVLFESLNVIIQEDSVYYEQLKDILKEV